MTIPLHPDKLKDLLNHPNSGVRKGITLAHLKAGGKESDFDSNAKFIEDMEDLFKGLYR